MRTIISARLQLIVSVASPRFPVFGRRSNAMRHGIDLKPIHNVKDAGKSRAPDTELLRAGFRFLHWSDLDDAAAASRRRRPWWSQPGSNRRPQACKASALPTELWPRCLIDPQTPGGRIRGPGLRTIWCDVCLPQAPARTSVRLAILAGQVRLRARGRAYGPGGPGAHDRTHRVRKADRPPRLMARKPRLRMQPLALEAKQEWWAWEDLNLRPHPYQGCALTN